MRHDQHHDFLNPELTSDNLDRWYVRRSILNAITHYRSKFNGAFLDIGCGVMPYRSLLLGSDSRITQYIGLDMPSEIYHHPNLYWNGNSMPLADATIDSAMATEVLEHCQNPDIVLREIFRVLRPGGTFFLTVPFLWPFHDTPHDEYRFTSFALERLLISAGFSCVEISALGGWDASLAQLLGLWVRRRPMGKAKRKILSAFILPLIGYLGRRDVDLSEFGEGTMVTGLSGIAQKA